MVCDCVKLLCVKFVCVKLLYVKFMCVKVMVCDSVKGRRREEEEEKEPGIQNQKQEPHTKLWGMKHL